MKNFFSAGPLWQSQGLFLLRVITGCFIIYHGWELFDEAKMKEYVSWDSFSASSYLPYVGKAAELVAGIFLLLGLLTRISCLIIIGTFGYIAFVLGSGKFWADDQYPFLFVMLALVFFFTGPGTASIDHLIFKKRR